MAAFNFKAILMYLKPTSFAPLFYLAALGSPAVSCIETGTLCSSEAVSRTQVSLFDALNDLKRQRIFGFLWKRAEASQLMHL